MSRAHVEVLLKGLMLEYPSPSPRHIWIVSKCAAVQIVASKCAARGPKVGCRGRLVYISGIDGRHRYPCSGSIDCLLLSLYHITQQLRCTTWNYLPYATLYAVYRCTTLPTATLHSLNYTTLPKLHYATYYCTALL